jgi:hypothetical protein
MLNWQPQTGEMTSCHWRKESVCGIICFSYQLRIKLYTFNQLPSPSCGYLGLHLRNTAYKTLQIQGSSHLLSLGTHPQSKAAMVPVGDGHSPDTAPDALPPSKCLYNNTTLILPTACERLSLQLRT